ncbi:MAG: hypothetical protein JAZ06_20060 [Candidatus Thiodiazotropha taylori]|nr:hypothetical protein [Candidatus Thiodiazotropha taylori]
MDSAQQSEGKTLFQQASQSHQPDVLIKRQFEQRNQTQKSKLANEFIASAGREGISQLAATPDGQHALAVVYDHADSDGRGLMRQMHEEQGSTAVDYTGNRNDSPSGQSADPLSVSDAGVDIGPRPTPLQYAALTSGVGYGLAENTVKGLLQIGEAVAKESPELKNVDNLEYAGIDEYQSKSREPGLTLPDWADVGNALKGHVQATNEAVKAAKEKGEYFEAGRAMSNDPMLQMTGLGDMAVFGAIVRMGKAAKLDSLTTESTRVKGGDASTGQVSDDKLGGPKRADKDSSIGENSEIWSDVNAPYNSNPTYYNIYSGGVRGENSLSIAQRAHIDSYLSKFDLENVDIRYVDDTQLSTGYGNMFGSEVLNIGSDVVPGNNGVGTLTANSRVSTNGTLAHEIVGHREAALAGRTQENVFLEEAQASIRAARFAPELSSTERFTLLRDAIKRLQDMPGGPAKIRDVKDTLYIHNR